MFDLKVCMSGGIEIGDYIYLTSINLNGLFRFDKKKSKLQFLCTFSEEDPSYALYNGAFSYGDEIWFVPQHGKQIAIYNIKTGNIEYVSPVYEEKYEITFDKIHTLAFSSGLIDESHFYILPAGVDAAMIVDMGTREIKTINHIIGKGEYIWTGEYHNGIIHAFTGDGKWRIEINPDTLSYERVEWTDKPVTDVVWNDHWKKYIVSSARENYITIFDENFKNPQIIAYRDSIDGRSLRGRIFSKGKDVFAVIRYSNAIERIDIEKKSTDRILLENIESQPYFEKVQSNEHIIGISITDNTLVYYENDSQEWCVQLLVADFKEIYDYSVSKGKKPADLFWSGNVMREGDVSLKGFLEYISIMG